MQIKLSSVNKTYKKNKHALKDINFKFDEVGFYTIAGKSGSGKSTLLNILTLLDFPSSGTLNIFGKDIDFNNQNEIDEIRKKYFSIVYESDNLLSNYTVEENLKTFCNFNNIPYEVNNIAKLFESLSLPIHLLEQKVSKLSGGEKQRVCILRALLTNRKVIVLDEPTSSLDYDNSVEIFELLKRLSKNHLVISVSHNVELCEKYADHMMFLENGEIIETKDFKTNNDKYNVIENTDNFVENFKKPANLRFFGKYFLNNALFYLLIFAFCFLLNGSTNLIFSNYSLLNADNVQKTINESPVSQYIEIYEHFEDTNNDGENDYFDILDERSINDLEEKIDSPAATDYKFNEVIEIDHFEAQIRSILFHEDLNEAKFKIIDGNLPSSDNGVLISETLFERAFKKDDSILNKELDFKVSEYSSYYNFFLNKKFIISGVFEVNSEVSMMVFDDSYRSEMLEYGSLESELSTIYFDLKGNAFANFYNNVYDKAVEDENTIIVNNKVFDFSFSDGKLLQYGLINYVDLVTLFAIYVPVLFLALLVCFLLVYSLIFKNKDNIVLYRILGLNFKKSLLFNGIGILIANIFGFIAAWPVSYFLVAWVNKSLHGSDTLMFTIVHLNWFIPILSLFVSTLLLGGLTYLLTKYLYKKKKNVKL